MKNSFLIISLFLLGFACSNPKQEGTIQGFTLQGTVEGLDSGQVTLYKVQHDKTVPFDSTQLHQGSFTFKGTLEHPELVRIKFKGFKYPYMYFFMENQEMKFSSLLDSTGRLHLPEISGSALQDQYSQYNDSLYTLRKAGRSYYGEYRKAQEDKDQEKINELNALMEKAEQKQNAFIRETIAQHRKTILAPYLIYNNFSYGVSYEELKQLTEQVDNSMANYTFMQGLNKRLEVLNATKAGEKALDFTMNDPEGNPVSLSSFKGKVLLVDFWASWCGPCRKENPNIVKMYHELHPKGLEILGVSFDKDKAKWLKAIEDDELNWTHVSDLKYWENAAGKLYGIKAIPHTLVIDPNGIIAANGLHGEELRSKIEELLESN
ncbi:redoxin domain-containing protein [Rapidithrix thailandica]|uniref:Redoxin domain-containing protein n=1 Tax=Rapidithrix thailandica TaxID=413964 RepID=A0AAW9S273_9BACT